MTTMSLGSKQKLFSRLLPKLLLYIHGQGYEVAMAEGYVALTTEAAEKLIGHRLPKTCHRRDGGHYKKIAQDLDLFRFNMTTLTWDYVTTAPDHEPFGAYWKSLHPLCRWGGDFPGDANHYSLIDEGVA